MAKKTPSKNQNAEAPELEWKTQGMRLPDAVWKEHRLDCVRYGLSNGEFYIQMRHFAKKNGFYEWLKSIPPK